MGGDTMHAGPARFAEEDVLERRRSIDPGPARRAVIPTLFVLVELAVAIGVERLAAVLVALCGILTLDARRHFIPRRSLLWRRPIHPGPARLAVKSTFLMVV